MKKWIAGPAVAALMAFGTATAVEATTAPDPVTADSGSDDDSDKTGLWGLLGLAGLAGLAGLKRRNDHDGRRDTTTTGGSSVR